MIKVGWLFYKHGEVFLTDLFQSNLSMVKPINNLLLIGYYLLNIAYAIITIAYWENVLSIIDMINTLTYTLGKIILLLAVMHYNNIFWLRYLTKTKLLNQ